MKHNIILYSILASCWYNIHSLFYWTSASLATNRACLYFIVKEPCSQVILLNFLYKGNNGSNSSFFPLIIETIELQKKKGVCSHLNKFFKAIIIKIKDITDFFNIALKDKCSKWYSSLTIHSIQYDYSYSYLSKKKKRKIIHKNKIKVLEKIPQENE